MEQGGHGFSTGLEYSTEIGASEEEITELCKICSRFDGLYATHTRKREDKAHFAIEEAVNTAYKSNVTLHISHLTPRGGQNDLDKAFDIVHKSNMSKLCVSEKEAQETVNWYKQNSKI